MPIGHQRHTLTGKLVDHAQHSKASAIFRSLVNEIRRPTLICPQRSAQRNTASTGQLPTRFRPHDQALLFVQPVHALGIDLESFALQQYGQTPVAIPNSRCGQLPQAQPQCFLWIAPCLVTHRPAWHIDQLRRPAFAQLIPLLYPLRDFPAPARLHSFFATTSCRMCLSNARSATSRLSFPFSSRN